MHPETTLAATSLRVPAALVAREAGMPHQFQLGQLVRGIGQIGAPARSQIYEVVSQLPGEQDVPCYRINGTEPGTLVVGERELVAACVPWRHRRELRPHASER